MLPAMKRLVPAAVVLVVCLALLAGPSYAQSGSSQAGGSTTSSGTGVAKGSVDPTASPYNAKFDVHWGTKPSFTNTSNIVTCTDCNFTATDTQGRTYAVVGQIVWGSTATNDLTTANSTLTTPECLIQSVDSNTQIHMGTIGSIGTACNAIATTTATGYLLWGDLDSATSAQVQSTANDPLFNAWTAASNACAKLNLPAGATFVEQAEFVTFDVNKTCGSNNSLTSMRFGYSVSGQGPFSTYLIPTPNFKVSTCTGPNGTGTACLFALPNADLSNFQIFGGGNSSCGGGFSGKTLTQAIGNTPGINMRVRNVMMFGWCGATTGTTGYTIGSGAGPTISGGDIYDLWVENYGATSVKSDPGASGVIEWHGGDYWSGNAATTTPALEVVSGTFKSSLAFNGTQNAGASSVQLDASTIYYTTDDVFQQAGGAAAYINMSGSGAVAHIKGMAPSGGSNNTAVFCVAGNTCTAYVADSQLNLGMARSFYSDTGSTLNIYDGGNNKFTAGLGPGVTNIFGSPSITGTAQTSGNIALTSGWGTSTVGTVSGDSHRAIFTITAAGVPGASPVITVTFPTAFYVAPKSCVITEVSGSFGVITNPSVGVPTATTVAITFSGTPVATQTYTFDLSCGP